MSGIQIIEFGVREYGAVIVLSLVMVGALLLNTYLTRRTTEKWWDFHAREFAEPKAQRMLERRDQKIKVLEERIRSEYICEVPVQVVNAGVPAWNVENQVRRLRADLLPLEPDVILAYHGYNGFDFLLTELPPVLVQQAPDPPDRPDL